MEPPFWGRGGRRGSAMAPFERAMIVSYRLSIVTVALSVTIRPQFAIECLRRSNQQGRVTLDPNLCDHNPPTSKTDGRTDRRTDRQTTCDSNTALCTKVHRAVKTDKQSRQDVYGTCSSTWATRAHRTWRSTAAYCSTDTGHSCCSWHSSNSVWTSPTGRTYYANGALNARRTFRT